MSFGTYKKSLRSLFQNSHGLQHIDEDPTRHATSRLRDGRDGMTPEALRNHFDSKIGLLQKQHKVLSHAFAFALSANPDVMVTRRIMTLICNKTLNTRTQFGPSTEHHKIQLVRLKDAITDFKVLEGLCDNPLPYFNRQNIVTKSIVDTYLTHYQHQYQTHGYRLLKKVSGLLHARRKLTHSVDIVY